MEQYLAETDDGPKQSSALGGTASSSGPLSFMKFLADNSSDRANSLSTVISQESLNDIEQRNETTGYSGLKAPTNGVTLQSESQPQPVGRQQRHAKKHQIKTSPGKISYSLAKSEVPSTKLMDRRRKKMIRYESRVVLTHEDMLAEKLRELNDILKLDIQDWSDYSRKTPSLRCLPRGRRTRNVGTRNRRAAPRRVSRKTGTSPLIKAAAPAEAKADDTAVSNKSSSPMRVKFSEPHNCQRQSSVTTSESIADSSSSLETPHQSAATATDKGDVDFSAPRNSQARGPSAVNGLHMNRVSGSPRQIPGARGRAHQSPVESDLRYAESASVRRWLRRKETSIRKLKRLKKEEDKRKERAEQEDAAKKTERQQMAEDAMREWIRKKSRQFARRHKRTAADRKERGGNVAPSPTVADGEKKDSATKIPPSACADKIENLQSEPLSSAASASVDRTLGGAESLSSSKKTPKSSQAAPVMPSQPAASTPEGTSGVRSESLTSATPSSRKPSLVDVGSADRKPTAKRVPLRRENLRSGLGVAKKKESMRADGGHGDRDAHSGRTQDSAAPASDRPQRRNPTSATRSDLSANSLKHSARVYRLPPQNNAGAKESPAQKGEALKEPPKTADARKSYDEWLRAKILNSNLSSDADRRGRTRPPSEQSEEISADVIRDAARRRLQRLTRGKPPANAPAQEIGIPSGRSGDGSNGGSSGVQPPAYEAMPAGARRPFRWKCATTVLLEPTVDAGAAKPKFQPSVHAALKEARMPEPSRMASPAGRRRPMDGGDIGSIGENPFRVPFPKLQRPRSSMERASFRGPEFASFVHRLLEEDFRPEPQGSETPDAVSEEAGRTKLNDPDKEPPRAESHQAPALPSFAAAKTPEIDLWESSEIFALTSVEIPRE